MTNDITVKIKADNRQLKTGMDQASRSVKGFSQDSEEMARNVAKAGAVVVTTIAAITAGVIAMAKQAAAAGIEIRNLAETAGTSTTAFQRMAEASKTVGIEQEKLSDILKDVNDKFGDFQATGAGPLADFFENIAPKIGVTADQFARLSGPEALQLYVKSLEEANVSQQEMTFYMEALASDSTRLLPLLRDNAREMNRLGDEAQRAGRIMDQDTIDAAVELDRAMSDMGQSLRTAVNTALLDNSEELVELARVMTETVIPAIGRMVGAFAEIVSGLAGVAAAAIQAGSDLKTFFETAEQGSSVSRRDARRGESNVTEETGTVITPGGPLSDTIRRGEVVSTATNILNPGEASEAGRPQLLPMTTGAPLDASGGLLPPMGMTSGTAPDPSGGLLPEQSPLGAARAAWEATQELQEEIETGTADHSQRLLDIAKRQAEEETRLREAAAAREIQIRSKTINMAIGLFANLGRESEVFAKAAVALNAAKSISEAIQNTSVAYTKALTVDPTGVMAARVALLGKAQIGIIAANAALNLSNRSGGGASGGGGSVSAPSQGGGQEQAPSITQNRSLTLIGDNFNRKQAIDIAEYMNEGTDNGLIIRGRG